jgi:hypothetical protein
MTRSSGREFIILEHNKVWFDYLSRIMKHLGFTHVRLIHAPLVKYSSYHWYDIREQDLSENIGLVICDGPPGSTQGGRYGLLPVMGEKLASNCVVLLDDTHRKAERRIIDIWRKYRCLSARRVGRFSTHTEVVFC